MLPIDHRAADECLVVAEDINMSTALMPARGFEYKGWVDDDVGAVCIRFSPSQQLDLPGGNTPVASFCRRAPPERMARVMPFVS